MTATPDGVSDGYDTLTPGQWRDLAARAEHLHAPMVKDAYILGQQHERAKQQMETTDAAPLRIDAQALRRITQGAVSFETVRFSDGTTGWLMGCGGEDCCRGRTLDEALARLLVHLANMAHSAGGWNVDRHETPDL